MTESLSRKTKLIYGSGDIGLSLTSTIMGAYFAIFLTDVVGISAATAAVAIFVGRSWDYINDPLIGHLSDRTRSRWGRRRPFLLFGALPFAIAFTMLWFKPPWDGQIALAAYYAVAYIVFDAAATFIYMPYFALTPELTDNYDERTSLTSYRMFFSILGSLIAFIVPMMIIGTLQPENAERVFMMGGLFGIASALPMLLVFFGTREKKEYMQQEQPNLLKSFRSAFKNKPFVYGALIFLLTWVSIDILQAGLLYFIKYVLQRESQSEIFMASIFVTGILALPIWNYASKRWGKLKAYIIGIAFWAVVQLVLISLSGSSAFWLIIFVCVLGGVGVAAAHVLPWAIIPDAVEWDEYKTGERHEGMFYSLVVLIRKITTSIAIPLVLLVLDATGYQPNAAMQPDSAVTGIRLIIGPIPAVLLALGIYFAFRYPLSREKYREVIQTLKHRKEKPALEAEK